MRYIDNNDGTITDTSTGLVWMQETLAVGVSYAEALAAVDAAGEGWRLPAVHELFGIVDHGRDMPAIDTDKFPDTKSDWYWTSTPTARDSTAGWVVGFSFGLVSTGSRDYDACVRAVRSVPVSEF